MKKVISEQTIKGMLFDMHFSEPEIYVDNEARGRSGHMSHAMANLKNGKYIVFNSNCSAARCNGHSAYGWIEYRISNDYCKTFGKVREFPFAKKSFEDGIFSVSVEKAVCCDDGTVVTFCLTNDMLRPICCDPHFTTRVVRSFDEGETWEEPTELCPYKGRVYDAIYHQGKIYVLFFCNEGDKSAAAVDPEHVYRIYESSDSGATFQEVCVVPFGGVYHRFYGALTVNPEGALVAYAYDEGDECSMDYAVSPDFGKTWTEVGKSFLKNKMRNPQIGKLDGQYILHGRAGVAGFVIYTSSDGITWDEGTLLDTEKEYCYYSNNMLVEEEGKPARLLIQYSEGYHETRVNVMHAYLTKKI